MKKRTMLFEYKLFHSQKEVGDDLDVCTRICLRKNQNKVQERFLKIALSGAISYDASS